MNYRHSYHAGNFADVLKHALQWVCLDYLTQKEKPLFVLDTHAGVGMYDLQGEQAQKTAEWEQGIGRLLHAEAVPSSIQGYLDAVRSLNDNGEMRWYPGSPWLTQAHLRAHDQLTLCELHPVDAVELAENFRRQRQVKVLQAENGYAAMKALLPPPQKRGMVLIDPPFEQRDEFDQVVQALQAGLKRWSTGVYAVWYPIKDPLAIGEFHQQVLALPQAEKVYAVDLLIREAQDSSKLNGCGMLFINPPYGLTQQAPELIEFLRPLLAQDRGAQAQAQWLTD